MIFIKSKGGKTKVLLSGPSSKITLVPYSARNKNYGALSIRGLSNHVSMSEKHPIGQLKQMVGCTPKELARLYRFAHILSSIDPTRLVAWSLLAHQFFYHDQSHFSRDFKMFTGHSPTDYFRFRRQVYAENPQRAQHPRLLPTG